MYRKTGPNAFMIAPPNSSQQPTTCRSPARRFRGSSGATRCVAPLGREGTWRLSERTLAGPARNAICLPNVMDPKQIVHSDPEIVSGTPVFVGTRVPAQALLDYLEGGETLEEFLDDFP